MHKTPLLVHSLRDLLCGPWHCPRWSTNTLFLSLILKLVSELNEYNGQNLMFLKKKHTLPQFCMHTLHSRLPPTLSSCKKLTNCMEIFRTPLSDCLQPYLMYTIPHPRKKQDSTFSFCSGINKSFKLFPLLMQDVFYNCQQHFFHHLFYESISNEHSIFSCIHFISAMILLAH